MEKVYEKINLKKLLICLVILASSGLVSLPLFQPGYFSMHDDMQVSRLYEMDLCLKDGQFPCRWVPDMGYSYGYPLFNYYPPFPYYLGEVFHLLGFGYIDSAKLLFISGFLVSGILMYLFARKLWGDWGGLLSAVLYLLAPYHSVDVYLRGAMNEFWALAFLPGIYWAISEIVESEKTKSKVALLAFFFSLLLLSHNLMAFIFAPTFVVFALLLIWLKGKNWKEKIWSLVLGSGWGFGLAAFFTLPVLLEKKFVHVETMTMGYFNFLAHYVSLGKLLFSRYWGYGSSSWGQTEGMPFQVGVFHWSLSLAALAGTVCLWARKKAEKHHLWLMGFFGGIFLLSLFLVHPRSTPIWLAISPLKYLQFPWRFLTLVIFSLSVLGGGVVLLLKNERLKALSAVLLASLAIILNINYFRPVGIIQISDEEKLFSPKGWNRLQTDAIFDYLPIYAQAPPAKAAPEKPVLTKGTAEVLEIKKGTDWYHFRVSVKEEARFEVPIYYFPGWKVWVDSYPGAISYDNPLGLITVDTPPGDYWLELKLLDTPVRRLSNTISLAGWLFFLYFLLRDVWRKRFLR